MIGIFLGNQTPKTIATDAFSIKWNTEFYYIFPSFSLLGKVTAKICRDKTKAIIVMSKWPTQHWYPSQKYQQQISFNPRIHKEFNHYIKSFTCKCSWPVNHARDITASLCESTCQKYLFYQTRWKEYCAENNIIHYNSTVDQFLNFFTELFIQGVPHSVLASAKSAVPHI